MKTSIILLVIRDFVTQGYGEGASGTLRDTETSKHKRTFAQVHFDFASICGLWFVLSLTSLLWPPLLTFLPLFFYLLCAINNNRCTASPTLPQTRSTGMLFAAVFGACRSTEVFFSCRSCLQIRFSLSCLLSFVLLAPAIPAATLTTARSSKWGKTCAGLWKSTPTEGTDFDKGAFLQVHC